MTDEALTPIVQNETPGKPTGRQADLIATVLAGTGTALAIIAAFWFFLGFLENDKRPEHLTSALVLTLGLVAFSIVPFACVTRFAWQAYRQAVTRAHLFWTIFLMVPWVGLGVLTISHTPLPFWCGFIAVSLATLLIIWAIISLILEQKGSNTIISQQNEMPNTLE